MYLYFFVVQLFKTLQSAHKSKQKLALGAFLFISGMNVSFAATYYVDNKGNDANTGTSTSFPFKTIIKSISKAVAGDTIYIRGGVYREQIDMYRGGTNADTMLKIFAYPNETPIIRGSDVVTGWVKHSGNIWKKTGWSANSQQVFVGGGDTPSLQQIGMPKLYTTFEYPKPVGSGVTSMTAGSFYYDAAALTLYVWLPDGSDPNTKLVEASTRRRLMFMGAPYIHVKGLAFRHSNTSAFAKMGAAVELGSNSIIENCDIQYTDFAGLSMGYLQTGAQALNCNVSNNGNSGVNGAGSYNFKVFNVKMNKNNTRNFNALWHAGGLKATTKAYGTVEYSEVAYNNGSGIWFDYANSGSLITIRNNYIHDNGPIDAAIYFEVSKNARIYNNVLANNERRGIYLSAADNTQVYNNTIVNTKGYAAIELGGMPRTGATLTNNQVYNNIVSHGTSRYDLFMAVPNGTTIVGNTSNYNNYFRPGGAIQLSLGTIYVSLSKFLTTTNLDKNSISVDPLFVSLLKPTSAQSYAVTSASPTINSGSSSLSAAFDYDNTLRPYGGAIDLGAFEYGSIATAAPAPAPTGADTNAPVVSISSPTPNLVVTKGSSVTFSAKATDNVGVKLISMQVDGAAVAKYSGDTVSFTWNSTNARIGTHSVYVSAIDEKNNLGKQLMTFTVK